jgi:tetratricopeptide (TPR) repeat protein
MSGDVIRSLRNQFYLGLHRTVLTEVATLKQRESNKEIVQAAEVFYYRSLVALGREEEAIKGIGKSGVLELRAVQLLATYRTATEENKELVIASLADWTEAAAAAAPAQTASPTTATASAAAGGTAEEKDGDGISKLSATQQLLGSLVCFEAKNYKEALKYVHKGHESLEMLAMQVQIYLRIERADLASKVVKAMQDIDDDDTLTTLAASWLYIAQGGDKVTEAFFLLQELVEKFGPSTSVLTSMGVCQLLLKKFTEAFAHLKQARDLAVQNKEKVSADTLVNSIVCLQHLRKPPEVIARITNELKQSSPNHAWLKKSTDMEAAFEKYAQTYKL